MARASFHSSPENYFPTGYEWEEIHPGKRSTGLDLFIDALLAHLRRWSGMGVDGHFDDDLTIVVIDFDPDTMSATFRTWAA